MHVCEKSKTNTQIQSIDRFRNIKNMQIRLHENNGGLKIKLVKKAK